MKRIGLTSTIPVEVVYAAGWTPCDLNNVFITSDNPERYISIAERDGYPRSACGWIKGIYAVALESNLDALLPVVEGDCSQTQAMVETLQSRGVAILPFSYPYGRDRGLLHRNIKELAHSMGTSLEVAKEWKLRLDRIRRKVRSLDEMTWKQNKLTSFENHYYQICCSDFNGNPQQFEAEVDRRLARAHSEQPVAKKLRIGYVGVPPIFTDLYDVLDELGVSVVFNEVQRQFAMPYDTDDIVEQYALYTYPYDVFARTEDISREVERRSIAGIIHYTQSFCFRQIQDIIIRKRMNVPVLAIEGDSPCKVDARTRVRLESFVEMLNWG